MDKKITILDGSIEEQTRVLKEFFGLRPDQTFQDLDIDEDEADE